VAAQVASQPGLEVTACFDYARGLRGVSGGRNTIEMLEAVLDSSTRKNQVQLGLFQVPQHHGLLARRLPPRWAEGIGVQHIKLYVFDDTVVLSGANLSSDYFTHRQDRCVVVAGVPEFADAAHAVVRAMYSSSVDSHDVLRGRRSVADRTEAFADHLTNSFGPSRGPCDQIGVVSSDDAVITPIAQFKHHGVRQDELVTQWLFRNAPTQSLLSVATGYFNLPSDHCHALLASPAGCVQVLTAAPQANGFYASAGALCWLCRS
jgi:CDP-diacylglycerol---glycerol-3-phosphate 3-phosphatidyltransferase